VKVTSNSRSWGSTGRPTTPFLAREFLEEISNKINRTMDPLIMGGDFNLFQSEEDKNNNRIN
jgi:endonuclease/exonuclease/phosphatase (EEP) superfamily protein YafD